MIGHTHGRCSAQPTLLTPKENEPKSNVQSISQNGYEIDGLVDWLKSPCSQRLIPTLRQAYPSIVSQGFETGRDLPQDSRNNINSGCHKTTSVFALGY